MGQALEFTKKLTLEAGFPPSSFQTQACLTQSILQAPGWVCTGPLTTIIGEGKRTAKQPKNKSIVP